MSRRKTVSPAVEQAEALQEQLQALEDSINQMHAIQIVYWPNGAVFRASGTAPGTGPALAATKAALQNVIGQLDGQIVEVAVQEAQAGAAEAEAPEPEEE